MTREQLPVSTKGSQVSPCLAEVIVKKLDPRWARQGATTALLEAAGYSSDVAVKSEFAGDLPAHLSCWSSQMGRSDVIVAKVTAPASDPSLRKLPRSIQFQGLQVSISVSRSLQNKHEQCKAKAADASTQQARKKATRVKRKANQQQQQQQQQQTPAQPAQQNHVEPKPTVAEQTAPTDPLLGAVPLVDPVEALPQALFPIGEGLPVVLEAGASLGAGVDGDPALVSSTMGSLAAATPSSHDELPGASSPLAGKRRDPESGSESSDLAEAPLSDSLAIVPLTPDDDHAQGLRRSIREHKKPRPYYAGAQSEPPDKPPVGKGIQRGFFK